MVHDAIAYAPYVSFRFLNLMALPLGPGVRENTAEFLLQYLEPGEKFDNFQTVVKSISTFQTVINPTLIF
ncbi:MAG: hypothetical protein BWK78_09005 [Thiotrichaceae bacterium IS1]|nr:MAG: hypothetical protein BWK78_09005 [Thiotrichaceae bacterium IS1]